MRKRIELHGSSFVHKGWGLLWLLRRMLGCSRAQRSPTRAGDAGSLPDAIGSYRWYRVVQVVNIVDMMNVETLSL